MRIFIRFLEWTFPLLHSHPFAHSYKTNNKRASIYLHGSFIWINWILRCWNCILKLFRGQYNLISNWILGSVYYTFHVCSLWTITEFPSLHLSDNDEVCWTIWGNFVNNADDIRVDDAVGDDVRARGTRQLLNLSHFQILAHIKTRFSKPYYRVMVFHL